MIRPHHLGETSTFLGQTCALCKQEFDVGDSIIICPEDGSRHHTHCWQANNNHCTAYGCQGQGEIGVPSPAMARPPLPAPTARPRAAVSRTAAPRPEQSRRRRTAPPTARPIPNAPGSKVRTLPAGNFGCVRACIIMAIVLVVIAAALACAGAVLLTDSLSGMSMHILPTLEVLVAASTKAIG
jgi:hypothetical protein